MLRIELSQGPDWQEDTDWQSLCEQTVKTAINITPHSEIMNRSFALEVSVKLSDNKEVQQLNAAYRGKNKPTNILSFPLIPSDLLDSLSNSDDGEILVGDLVMAHDICVAEAKEKNIAVTDHARHLLVHGTLHLLGYDHETENDALIMEALEVKALENIGIANPYLDMNESE